MPYMQKHTKNNIRLHSITALLAISLSLGCGSSDPYNVESRANPQEATQDFSKTQDFFNNNSCKSNTEQEETTDSFKSCESDTKEKMLYDRHFSGACSGMDSDCGNSTAGNDSGKSKKTRSILEIYRCNNLKHV